VRIESLFASVGIVGKGIVERQEKDGWGSGVIDRIARGIQNEFPGIEGFSRTNVG
jgi:hypothetical protein